MSADRAEVRCLFISEKELIMTKSRCFLFVALIFCTALTSVSLRADEGMWLFENPPTQQVKAAYDFALTEEWLEHVRLASCRVARRGSASFISPNGLILTNHHVAAHDLHALSTPEDNLLEKGFYAEKLEDERKCPGLEIFVLEKIEDVTEIVSAAKEADSIKTGTRSNAFIAQLEQKKANETGLRCEVITLYQGGAYHLYCYKVYTDVRLVWAPEESIAAFGGDPDNYEFPRYCLDAAMFRAYENGKPAKIEHYLKWGTGGVKDGELVFVSGHPGTTNRAFTKEHLEFLRDVHFPWLLQKLFRREVLYSAYGNRSLENQRRIADDLGSVQNYRKRAIGQLDGLQTPTLWEGKLSASDENASDAVKNNADAIAEACQEMGEIDDGFSTYLVHDLLEKGEAFNSQTFRYARTLVRLAEESQKPNEERLPEYRDGNLAALKAALLSDTSIYEDVEVLKLTDSLTMLQEVGQGTAWNACIEEGFLPSDMSPKTIAQYFIVHSKLRDVAERKRLMDGGAEAIENSEDPMIVFALSIDEQSRDIRQMYDEIFTAFTTAAYTELARQRFTEQGTDVYPDATLTLRLSHGKVQGYTEDDDTEIEPVTNIAGMFERAASHKNREPFDPPQSWKDGKAALDENCAFNLVSTNDIIGGNSGSPLINTKGELVGLVFDGNIYSLSNNFVYSEEQSRCVSVHADVVLEALTKIYKAERIVKELGVTATQQQ